jgi:hypothetical protein
MSFTKSLGRVFTPLLFVSCIQVFAQSTVVNVPSTDVVSAKDVYLEFDFISNYSHHYNGGFQTYVPRAVVGVGYKVEVGANVSYTDGFGTTQPVEIQPNVKWRFYENEPKGIAGTLGCIAYVPVSHRRGTDTFGLCYSVMSKKFAGNYGPKFTGGGYALVHRSNGNGTKGGALAAYEQPLVNRLAFVMDWYSGNNRFGYLTPGFTFQTTSRSSLFSGYTIGNHGRRNHAFFTFWGVRL